MCRPVVKCLHNAVDVGYVTIRRIFLCPVAVTVPTLIESDNVERAGHGGRESIPTVGMVASAVEEQTATTAEMGAMRSLLNAIKDKETTWAEATA